MPEERVVLEAAKASTHPLIFISHDSRDADLAEAFSNLLKSVSAGMLKSFRSSDKRGSEGIEFGDEWYKTVMSKLDKASDVVCLITERSVGRPWILYEAGVAKGKMDIPVHGLALGVPLSVASVGPFYQFQNSDDSEESLSKLVMQLCKRIPGLEPDEQVVRAQLAVFKSSESEALKTLGDGKQVEKKLALDNGAAAKVLEEMKLVVRELPLQLEHRLADMVGRGSSKRSRRFHPELFLDMAFMSDTPRSEPIGLLMLCGFLKDDYPWLYDLALAVYRAVQDGSNAEKQEAIDQLLEATRMTLRGPMNEMLFLGRETYSLNKELPFVLEEFGRRLMAQPAKKRSRLRTL